MKKEVPGESGPPFFYPIKILMKIIYTFGKTLNMKTDKYWSADPKKSGSYADKGRVEGKSVAPPTLAQDMALPKMTFKLTHKNSKSNFSK